MDIFDKLRSEITQLDAKDEKAAIRKGQRHNIYALSIMLGACEEIEKAVNTGTPIHKAFADNLNACRGMHGIAKRLGLPLDVVHGKWIVTK